MGEIKILGVSGVAGAGKDTFCNLLGGILGPIYRHSLADKLKWELYPFLVANVGISPFTENREDKTLIRDFLVTYARIKRFQTKGKYFTRLIEKDVLASAGLGLVVIPDIRYDQYEEDEVHWLKGLGGKLVHITRIDGMGNIQPANQDEAVNDPKLYDAADFRVHWPTLTDHSALLPYIQPVINAIR